MDDNSVNHNGTDTSEYIVKDNQSDGQASMSLAPLITIAIVVLTVFLVWMLLFRNQSTDQLVLTDSQQTAQTSPEEDQSQAASTTTSTSPDDDSSDSSTGALPQAGPDNPISTALVIAMLAAIGHYGYTKAKATARQ